MNTKLPALIMSFMITGLITFSCKDSETLNNPLNNSSINFSVSKDTMLSNRDSLTVQVEINTKALVKGSVNIKLSGDAAVNTDYITKPEAVKGVVTLNLLKESQKAQLLIIRSSPRQTEKTINLTLENPSSGFVLGNISSASIKLMKEIVDSINFSDSFIHISETDTQGYDIALTLGGSVTQTEHVNIEIINPTGIEYGTHYSTNIAAVQNVLKLDVTPGTKTLSFKIIPVNNQVVSGNYELAFRIGSTTGQLRKGIHSELKVRVEEDDKNIAIHSIAELRNLFKDYNDEFFLPNDYFIEGIITSGTNVADEKIAYIQDTTAGIMLRFTLPKVLKLGDKVRLNLKGASGNYVNDQKAFYNITDLHGVKVDENQAVMPIDITIEQFASGNYEGKRVRINNVQFSQANGPLTFQGVRQITNGSQAMSITTFATAPFSNTIVPSGKFSVTGIAGDWGRILPQVYNTDIVKTDN